MSSLEVLLLVIISIQIHQCSIMKPVSLSLVSTFPVNAKDNFFIKIHLPKLNFATLIFRCRRYNKIVEEIKIYSSFPSHLTQLRNGEYFSLVNFTSKDSLLEVTLQFAECGNYSDFEVSIIDPIKGKSSPNNSENTIGHFNVDLVSLSKLQFFQMFSLDKERGFQDGNYVKFICQSEEIHPSPSLMLIGLDKIKPNDINISQMRHAIQLILKRKISYHMMEIGCKTNNEVVYESIKIFQPSDDFEIFPKISEYSLPETNISCKTKKGTHSVNLQWILVSGPENAHQYYSTSRNPSTITMKTDAPNGSKWIFICTPETESEKLILAQNADTVVFQIKFSYIKQIVIYSTIVGFVLILVAITISVNAFQKRDSSNNIRHIFLA